MISVVIKGTGVYIPDNKVYNDYFIEYFDQKGVKVEGLMNHLGRRKRYLASEDETSLTMAVEAVKDCIAKSDIGFEDLDMLVFVSDMPEYLSPTNALKIIDEVGAVNVTCQFDFNSNCTGMLMAAEVVNGYMRTKANIRNAVIVGSFNISSIDKKDDTVVYPNFADASAAILLSREEGEDNKGYIDSITHVDASFNKYVTFPKCGLSKMAFSEVSKEEKKIEWIPFDMKFISDKWCEMITDLTARNNLNPDDIDYYVFSQLSDFDNMSTLKKLDVSEGKYFFLGKEYGYTGNTCPFIVLNRMWDVMANAGNKIIFCSVGAGYTAVAQLYYF